MNFLRSKMFVSNDLTKGFQIKSAVKKCYLSRKKYGLSSTREIQKTEEKLSATLVCIFLMRICSFTTLINKIIYNVQTFTSALIFSNLQFVFTFRGFLKITSTPLISLIPTLPSPVSHFNPQHYLYNNTPVMLRYSRAQARVNKDAKQSLWEQQQLHVLFHTASTW